MPKYCLTKTGKIMQVYSDNEKEQTVSVIGKDVVFEAGKTVTMTLPYSQIEYHDVPYDYSK